MYYPPVEVKVWGDLACFTRPEMKVERASYPVMTPSAARGVLEAIFWKPEFQWEVREIRVLRPIRYFSMLRNEVKSRASYRRAQQRIKGGEGYFADEDRTQRHTLALRDVAYIITADVALRPGVNEEATKFRDQFRRRVEHGQCYIVPYLGCREFAAHFAEPDGKEQPLDLTEDLGLMLFDLKYQGAGSSRGEPYFFMARLEHGILRVPPALYPRRV
ncbi:MAG TPA: type I-C CRISPR-associated protein Cas5c [Ktedonobacterales bacterium]|nr:type I-C CRISPR-associated protein Cas5c [Ktedonobacterales bacterium]